MYSYREAVIDGYLVDHDVPHRLKTKLSVEGIHYNLGDTVAIYDPVTDEITNKEFTYESRGYSREEVDNYLDSVCEQLDRPDLTCKMLDACINEIVHKEFSIASRGYLKSQVDNYLDEVIEKLEALVSEAKNA